MNSGIVRIIGGDRVMSIVNADTATPYTGSGRIYTVWAVNTGATDLYLAIFDTTILPSDDAWPASTMLILPVFAGTPTSVPFDTGTPFYTGVTAAVSSTLATFTYADTGAATTMVARINYVATT